jgi:hypothetical protein
MTNDNGRGSVDLLGNWYANGKIVKNFERSRTALEEETNLR